jgi:DNA-binding helix-hairpin-helix protein with protein kinase domain
VVGDVNEGNILVNARGMIAFIDCDSFQVKDGSNYHFCEVGVPRYTPPELLVNTTFDNVVRTVNTDSFSMAILIFQLLFLGRHPFAGKNNSKEDIDEETAIKQHYFAFSLRNKNNKLSPPNDSFSLSYLNDGLASLFQDAFEKNTSRPAPAEWIKELDVYLKGMVTCANTKSHTYPSKLSTCIWCAFKEKRNILYFFDDSYLHNNDLLQNIDSFVNGFKIEKIHFQKIELSLLPAPVVTAAPIDKKYIQYKQYKRNVLITIAIVGMALCYFSMWYILLAFIIAAILNDALPWGRIIKKEAAKRKTEHTNLQGRLYAAIEEHNQPAEFKAYGQTSRQLMATIDKFRGLPQEVQLKRKALEERLYNVQLHIFLSRFYIENHTIPSFGETRKKLLYNGGILNAADISKLQNSKVQGIGPAYTQTLLSWQRQVSSTFVYMPDNAQLNRETAIFMAEIDMEKKKLEIIKQTILNKQAILKKQVEILHVKVSQAEADYEAFKKATGAK